MILSAQTIRELGLVSPLLERSVIGGKSRGLSVAGYDITIADDYAIQPGAFTLACSVEKFDMPNNVLGMVKDKSSWARRGLSVFNTVIEPGWRGYLTLELVNHGPNCLIIDAGEPIAQVIFCFTDKETAGYGDGKYQNQGPYPTAAIREV